MNVIGITGRLTAEPELKTTQNGLSVCSFTVAVKRPKVKDTTDFINCVAWRQSAEYLCQYGFKGALVEVSGSLQSRQWEDKNGNKRTSFDVVADSLSVNSNRQSGQTANIDVLVDQLKANDVEFEEIVGDDDIPF